MIEIYTLADLDSIRYGYTGRKGAPNGGFTGFELMNDLDFNNKLSFRIDSGWLPIASLEGIFEGHNHEIKHLTINRIVSDNVGLFGSINGSIKSLVLSDVEIRGGNNTGAFVGTINCKRNVTSCKVINGEIIGNSNVGGLFGEFQNQILGLKIDSCINNATVKSFNGKLGGLIGNIKESNISTTMSYSENHGIIQAFDGDNVENVGGLIGQSYGRFLLKNCFNDGKIMADKSSISIGGLIGHAINMSMSDSYNHGEISVSSAEYVGGLIGKFEGGIITGSYNLVDIKSPNSSFIGGIIGFVGTNYFGNSEIVNCFNKGDLEGLDVGGLIGGLFTSSLNIESCFNEGDIVGGYNLGGLIGSSAGYGNTKYCYSLGNITTTSGGFAVGGFIGYGFDKLEHCFFKGNITINHPYRHTGGLYGYMYEDVDMNSCYSYANISINSPLSHTKAVYDLVNAGQISNSLFYGEIQINVNDSPLIISANSTYWDSSKNTNFTSSSGTGYSTSQLQAPTSNTGIYENWSSDVWDFGTSSEYPVLKNMPISVENQRK